MPPVVGGFLIDSFEPVGRSVGASVLAGVINSGADGKSDDCSVGGCETDPAGVSGLNSTCVEGVCPVKSDSRTQG
jgi:hypothetical protein